MGKKKAKKLLEAKVGKAITELIEGGANTFSKISEGLLQRDLGKKETVILRLCEFMYLARRGKGPFRSNDDWTNVWLAPSNPYRAQPKTVFTGGGEMAKKRKKPLEGKVEQAITDLINAGANTFSKISAGLLQKNLGKQETVIVRLCELMTQAREKEGPFRSNKDWTDVRLA
jgi:hypothetical protein